MRRLSTWRTRIETRLKTAMAGLIAMTALAGAQAVTQTALAQAAISHANGGTHNAPIVVEFFTSQSCGSCIPAAAYFRELAAEDDIVALAWHVDYWNARQTKNGAWVDPYSDKRCSDRQRKYNINLRKRSSVFTPQMVVNAQSESIGSATDKVDRLINAARSAGSGAVIEAARSNGKLEFTIGKSNDGGNAYLVTFKRQSVTTIKEGENAGKTYHVVNAVTEMKRLGVVHRVGATLTTDPPTKGHGCALLVQAPGQGAITAAAYCPS